MITVCSLWIVMAFLVFLGFESDSEARPRNRISGVVDCGVRSLLLKTV
ncbi:hypothetical protein MEN41_07460 [Dolichospermum sp. ST_con]|nr:hypothetical protein [Dolichospermum sp. ST_con]MDD1419815.1 hypothetical protein [Dolichospermum sp. ST_sed1]MDD1426490.1 hypothetical protein [Dolichospermum sp. ST_sed9]MDD1430924.1 hypothetical protein [Dolichospermum sp. ST_sed6]MDD1436326.1 hypothetical protein [Dolichospermum sp. ST_sed10]MDD1441445.1 hypothetical protein [Dolichospermum sp. ST_sed3]MDD1446212.1 hypothetical protein [Dolichospermum sp. ST_sed8]MDD1453702.1 hypothetical protein [Dolichospermum sp. ST_sed7]MDD146099